MAHLTEEEIGEMIDKARADERERCALLADALATRFEASAKAVREGGSYTTRALWPFGKRVTCVRPAWAEKAQSLEAAATALRCAIAQGCRKGWDPRKVAPHEVGMAIGTGVDGDPTLIDLERRAT